MFNAYLPRDTIYSRIPENKPPRERAEPEDCPPQAEKNAGVSGILKRLKQMDKGDVLILLILLLLVLDGDNTELIITLGLVLLLSL